MEQERQLFRLILKENLLEMMSIVGQIMEYSILKEDVMQNVLIYQQKKNLKYSMPLSIINNNIRFGAVLENVEFVSKESRVVNYNDISITENTRVSYPLDFIPGAKNPAVGGHPKNIFFLTCDAYGVLPPVARLTPE